MPKTLSKREWIIVAVTIFSLIFFFVFAQMLAWLSGYYINSTILPLLLAPLALWGLLAYIIKIHRRAAAQVGIAAYFGVIAYMALISLTGSAFGYSQDRLLSIAIGSLGVVVVALLAIPAIFFRNRYLVIIIMAISLLLPPVAGDVIDHLPKDHFTGNDHAR